MIPIGNLASGDSPPYIDENFDVPGTLSTLNSPLGPAVPWDRGMGAPGAWRKVAGALQTPSDSYTGTFITPLPLLQIGRVVRIHVDIAYGKSGVTWASDRTGAAGAKVILSPKDGNRDGGVTLDGYMGGGAIRQSWPTTATASPSSPATLAVQYEVLSSTTFGVKIDVNGERLADVTKPYAPGTPGARVGLLSSAPTTSPVFDNFKVWIS